MKKIIIFFLTACTLFTLCVPASALVPSKVPKVNTYWGQFSDISPTSWCAEYVQTVYEYGLMGGISDTTFNPDGNLSVAAAIAIACRLHSLCYEDQFDFTPDDIWYQPFVDYAIKNKIIKAEETYSYDTPVTRSEFALLISNALPDLNFRYINSNIKEGDIPDISSGSPLHDAVYALKDAGVLKLENGFQALMISQTLGKSMGIENAFYASDDSYAAIYRLYWAGILTGNDAYGTFTPNAAITRGSAAVILSRVMNPSLRKQVTLQRKPFPFVPVDQLANRSSLQKKASQSQLAQAYEEAKEIVEPLTNLSREAQICGITAALRIMSEDEVAYSMTAPHYNDPYGFFVLHTASCAGSTRATGLCLNILGIPYEHVNENAYSHQWTRINMNGTYWICDPYGLYCGPEEIPYKHPTMS